MAQAPSFIADQQEQRDRAERQAREREWRQALPEVRAEEDESRTQVLPQVLPKETDCFLIQSIRLEGERHREFAFVQRLLDRYAGQCIGRQGAALIVRQASDRILAGGYVTTQVGLPEQDLSRGVLVVHLRPGTIRQIRFDTDASGAWPERTWRSAFPVRSGDLLDLHVLEQGLEQLKRVPSQDAAMPCSHA
ncbi:MAG: hypothetical protein LBL59_11690 [Xanthomonadaceae bacterium]|nr:hypothetical protein [Xanthomonadaceae bacterium]